MVVSCVFFPEFFDFCYRRTLLRGDFPLIVVSVTMDTVSQVQGTICSRTPIEGLVPKQSKLRRGKT